MGSATARAFAAATITCALAATASADPKGLLGAAAISAEGTASAASISASPSPAPAPAALTFDPVAAPHAVYVDLLGRAGLYGVGYDWRFSRHFAVGAAVSYYHADGDHLTTLAPYLAVYPLIAGRHSLFLQAGPTAIHRFTPSPVPEWNGYSQMNYSAEAALGWEFRGPVLVRVYGMLSQGDHLMPWVGASIGRAL